MLVALDSEPVRRDVVAANCDLDAPAGSKSRIPATRNGHLAPAGTASLALSAITRHRLPPSSGRRSFGRRPITTP